MASISNENLAVGSFSASGQPSITGSRSSLIEHDPSETLLLGTSEPAFKSLNIYVLSSLNVLLLVAFAALIWLLPGWPFPTEWSEQEGSVFVLISVNGGVWLVVAISDRLFSYYHHIVRRRGYLAFYNRTEYLRRLPFYVFSATSVALAIVLGSCMRWIPESVSDAQPSRLLVIQSFLSFQIVLILPLYVAYTVVVVQFNWVQPLPDVDGVPFGGTVTASTGSLAQTGDMRSANGAALQAGGSRSQQLTLGMNEVGVRDEPQLEQLLDRQADLITYYRQRNDYLTRKLARMSKVLEQRQVALPNAASASAINI